MAATPALPSLSCTSILSLSAILCGSLRKAMRQHKVDRGETDGNGKLLLF